MRRTLADVIIHAQPAEGALLPYLLALLAIMALPALWQAV